MSDEFTIKDYIKFLTNKKKIIFISIGFILLVYAVLVTISNVTDSPSEREPLVENIEYDEEVITELMDTNYNLLTEQEVALLVSYLEEDAYFFNFYIENGDYTPFTNNEVLKKILTTEEMIELVEQAAGYSIEPNPHLGIVITREYGDILSLRVGTGNQNANRAISQEFYEIISNDELEFFENKEIYLMNNEPVNLSNELLEAGSSIDEDFSENSTAPSMFESVGTDIVMGIIAIIGGVVVGIIVALLSRLVSSKISYLYDYDLQGNEKVIKFDEPNVNTNNIKELNLLLSSKEVFILSEDSAIAKELNEKLNINTKIIDDITSINRNFYKHCILITKVNQTNKSWIKKQRILTKSLNIPVDVIQFSA